MFSKIIEQIVVHFHKKRRKPRIYNYALVFTDEAEIINPEERPRLMQEGDWKEVRKGQYSAKCRLSKQELREVLDLEYPKTTSRLIQIFDMDQEPAEFF